MSDRALNLRDVHDEVHDAWRHASSARALIGDDAFGVQRLDAAIEVLARLLHELRWGGIEA